MERGGPQRYDGTQEWRNRQPQRKSLTLLLEAKILDEFILLKSEATDIKGILLKKDAVPRYLTSIVIRWKSNILFLLDTDITK